MNNKILIKEHLLLREEKKIKNKKKHEYTFTPFYISLIISKK